MIAECPFPESLPTLARQARLLEQGRKPALFIPHWAPRPLFRGPAEVTPAGVVYYDPERLTPSQIHAAVVAGRLGEILGYGVPSKPDDGDRCVVLLDADGHEVVAVFANAACEPAAREALARMADPDDTIHTVPPLAVLRARATWWKEYFDKQPDTTKGTR